MDSAEWFLEAGYSSPILYLSANMFAFQLPPKGRTVGARLPGM
jgi:hypothetical protein